MGAVGYAALYPVTDRGRGGAGADAGGAGTLSPVVRRSTLPAPALPTPAVPGGMAGPSRRPGFAGPSPAGPSLPGPTRRSPALAGARRSPAPAGNARRSPALRAPALRCGRAKAQADSAARRRLVMTVLLTALAIPTLVALGTGSTALWWVVVAFLPVVCTYAAVVVRAQRLQAEKEFNVAFLGGTNLRTSGLEDIFTAAPATGSIDLRERRQVSAGLG